MRHSDDYLLLNNEIIQQSVCFTRILTAKSMPSPEPPVARISNTMHFVSAQADTGRNACSD
jgi:hypothetical protein